ncbi:MAG TPA: hypothetical protein DCQ50_01615 [Chryseobacterium sp.]|nr:hypothetical protein [Chryseobacterium sp.]
MANLETIKHQLLHCRYGKFDELEMLFRESELLQLKPRIIWERMIAILELESGDINRVSFYSWLNRYRRRKVKTKELEEKEHSWKAFQITDPAAINLANEEDVNFISVNYKK